MPQLKDLLVLSGAHKVHYKFWSGFNHALYTHLSIFQTNHVPSKINYFFNFWTALRFLPSLPYLCYSIPFAWNVLLYPISFGSHVDLFFLKSLLINQARPDIFLEYVSFVSFIRLLSQASLSCLPYSKTPDSHIQLPTWHLHLHVSQAPQIKH